MASADTAQTQLRYLKESTWGETPAAAMQNLRFTGESVKVDLQTTQSEEIRSDRQITDLITTSVSASGGINGEFSYEAYDDFIAAALYTDWDPKDYSAATISAQANALTLPAGHAQNFKVGDVITASGFATGGLNTTHTVAAVRSESLALTAALSAEEEAGASVTLTRTFLPVTVDFDDAGTITLDTGEGANFTIGDVIAITGTASNNITVTIDNLVGDVITVSETLVDETAVTTAVFTRAYTSSSIAAEKNSLQLATGHAQTFVVGQGLKVTGFTGTAGNNSDYIVTRVGTNRLGLNKAVVNDAEGETVHLIWNTITNGTTRSSFTIEKEFSDITKFLAFTGMVVSQMGLTVQAQNKITCSFDFMGKNGTASGATVGTGTALEPAANEVMNAGDNVGTISADGATLALVRSLSIQANNNLRGKPQVGLVGNADIGSGRLALTGDISMYFEDYTIYTKYINSESMSLSFELIDGDGAGRYVITLPKIKFSKADIVAGGPDQDVMVDGSYQAVRDPVTGKTIVITKL